MMEEKVAISSEFLTAFAHLPRQIQGKVTEFLSRFRNCPSSPGIHYEKIAQAADQKICSVRIDDTYRGIVARQPESGIYLLLWVDHHDRAYDWAARKRCEVNPRTGSIQVFDVKTLPPPARPEDGRVEKPLFGDLSREDMLKLGVPAAQEDFVRSLLTKEQFYAAKGSLPGDAFESLTWLAEGFPLEEVLALVGEQQPEPDSAEENDLSRALERPGSQRSFVVVEGEDELRRIMAAPLEKWRVFLHPTQFRIVHRDYSGSARVLGGAGTGKTVVAMHRARFLASRILGGGKVLFTTFTANLAADIRENLRKICTPEELGHIEVIHLDAWISQYLRESGFQAEIRYDDAIDSLWSDAIAMAGVDLPYPRAFFEDEWNRVVIAQEALTLQEYLKASRSGRGTRLDRKKRMQVWKVFECYESLYKERHVRDINTAMYECTKLLAREGKARYAHVIVDEGQDFSDNAFRLLRALAGEPRANDLFIVGDSHQRIYQNRPVLSRCGIQVRGRSSILRVNYRTTEEIRRFAFHLLNGIPFDDLDEEPDSGDSCRSLMHGEAPVVKNFRDATGEFSFVLQEVCRLQESGVPLSDICVVARTRKLVEDYCSLFTKAGIRCFAIKRSRVDNRRFGGLRVATMHRVKGLEFQYVFVCAVNARIVPLESAINRTDPVSEQESRTSEKCLLYVALTRAQRGAWVTSYGKPSELL